jgi:YfiH family protein
VTLALIKPQRALGGDIEAVATTRAGGVSAAPWDSLNLGDHVGDSPAAVAENRERLRQRLGVDRIQWLRQVHGRDCVYVGRDPDGREASGVPTADAAWTDRGDVALGILTADCVPVVLAAPAQGIVGVAHAGWRGLVGGVLEALLAALPVKPRDLVAWLGPAVGPAAYQVDATVARAVQALPDGSAVWARAATEDPESSATDPRFRLDLFALATVLLVRGGVPTVDCERLCTHDDGRFFSHRRASASGASTTGRIATLAWRSS